MNVLMIASTASMIEQFNMDNIEILEKMGYKVEVACNMESGNAISNERVEKFKEKLKNKKIECYQIPIPRSIYKVKDLKKSCEILKKICTEKDYKIVHCHSPIGGAIVRFVCKNFKKIKVIYTAHGLHFFKGAPLLNWMLYYPVERWLSRYTDILITINQEDYKRAKNDFKAKKIEYIAGVGIDYKKYSLEKINKTEKRSQLGLEENNFVILSVGELNKNKNHEVVIKAIANIKNQNIHYIICGQGPLEEYLRDLSIKLEVESQVHILGFRNDISEICKASDIFAFFSLREGLGLSALEAMASGLPLITSNIHGIVDYSINGETGFNCASKDTKTIEKYISELYENIDLRKKMAENNKKAALKFSREGIIEEMKKIYESVE